MRRMVCPCATIGHATALPRPAINSRRRMSAPGSGQGIVTAGIARGKGVSDAKRKRLRQKLTNLGQELTRAVGLGHVGITPSRSRLLFIPAQGVGRDGHDRNRTRSWIGLD